VGLTLEKEEIVVNSMMRPGVPGFTRRATSRRIREAQAHRQRLFEAATAVNQAALDLRKESCAGHSSNMSIFGQTDD
jgi:hypothetical protein